jgi:hypothetical protein
MKWLLLGCLCGAACASTTPAQREAERARLERCAQVELYPMGVSPPRPYRVLGPVSVTDGTTGRRRDLQNQACALGADAVIDVVEQTALAEGSVAPNAYGRQPTLTTGGTAIAFTDGNAQ